MAIEVTSTDQRIKISGPYKAFTGGAGNTTTVINYASNDAPAYSDGNSGRRFLMWKNSNNTSNWEIRFITSATSTTVTVGDGGFSTAPPSGANFVISTTLLDIEKEVAPSVMRRDGSSYQMRGKDFELQNGAFVADVNCSLVTKSTQTDTNGGFIPTYPIANGCALQFGRLIGGEANNSTETIGGCQITFEVSNDTLIFTDQESANTQGPILNFYGCLIESYGNGFSPFIRSPGPMRIIGCICDGPMGGRLYSAASELVDTRFSGNLSGGVAWSLGASFTRPIDNAFFYQNAAAIKSFQGFQGTFTNTRFADSNYKIIEASANQNLLFRFIDCTTFANGKISANRGNYEQLKSINYTTTDSDGNGLSDVKVAVYDNTSTIQDGIKTSSSGNVNAINARFFRKNHNVSTPTNYAPFDIRIRKYGYQYQDFQSAVSEPIKQEFRLPENTVTVLSEVEANALTGIDIDFINKSLTLTSSKSLSEIYDFTQSQMALDANMDKLEFFKSQDGVTFTFSDDWNLILNASGNITSATGKTLVFNGNGKLQLNDTGNTINDLVVVGDINLGAIITPITNVTAGVVDFSVAETYTLDGCTISEVRNSSAGDITINLLNGSTVTTNTGPNITLLLPPIHVTFTDLQVGSKLVIFLAGDTTPRYTINSSGTSGEWTETYNSDINYDVTIQKAGFFPVRLTNLTASTIPITMSINQLEDRAYKESEGLTYGTNANLNTDTKEFSVSVATTVQNYYSFWIEEWINNPALENIKFPISTFGGNSFSFDDGYHFADSSLQHLSRDGFRYVDNGTVTARYAAILSQGVSTGLQAEYQQAQGGIISDAQNTGNVDQVIQIYADSANDNFDYTEYLIFKVQGNGFRQAEANIVSVFGKLEEQFYVTSLNTLAIPNFTTGNPNVTGLQIIDEGENPVSWDAGDGTPREYSLTIRDTGNNSGENILRWLNYNLSLDDEFQEKDPFYYPEMVIYNGSSYETVAGVLYGSTSNAFAGVRVIDNNGNPHRDFTRFQSDDGTYGVPVEIKTVFITGITTGSRLRIYNKTKDQEVFNNVITGTSYTEEYTEGNGYSQDDLLNIRIAQQSGATAKLPYETQVIVGATGWSLLVSQEDDVIYNQIAIDGKDGDEVKKFQADYQNSEIDIIIAEDFKGLELYSRYVYFTTTEDGIRTFFKGFNALDIANYENDVDVSDLYLNNNTSENIKQIDNVRIFKSDDEYPVRDPTTGGGGIDVNWRNTVYPVGLGNLETKVDEVKTEVSKNTKLLFANEKKTRTNWQKIDRDTGEILFDKYYTRDSQGNETLTEVTE